MKPLNISELELLAENLRTLEGGQVQKILGSRREFALGLFKNQKLTWIWVVLNSQLPALFICQDLPRFDKVTTPVLLFLKAHIVNSTLTAVRVHKDWGRILKLEFGPHQCIEIRLFAKGLNLIVQSYEKQVAWAQVQPLGAPLQETEVSQAVRTPEEFYQQWLQWKSSLGTPTAKTLDLKAWRQQQRQKIEKSIAKIQQDMAAKAKLQWRAAGEWIRVHGSLNVPAQFQNYVDSHKSLAWNLENCFSKAKDIEGKIQRAQARINELKQDLAQIAHKMPSPPQQQKFSKQERIPQRTLYLDENLRACYGKSAKDNLLLLRQAKPWHLWLHLKDYPSAHCIAAFPKTQKPSEPQIKKIALWLIQESQKTKHLMGGLFEVVITECRYVVPIKGDTLGRVTYRNERVLRLRISDQK